MAEAAAPERRTNEFAALSPDARVELATTRIRAQWGTAAGVFLAIGQVLVDACHDGDEPAALAPEAETNALFLRIARSLGTLKGGPSEKTLNLARRVAAASRVVRGHFWDVVPYCHKEQLVRLSRPETIAAGAKSAVELGWTIKQTEKWVDAERAREGRPKAARGVRLVSARGACTRLADAVDAPSLARIAADFERLDEKERRKVKDELEKAVAALQRLRHRLDRTGG